MRSLAAEGRSTGEALRNRLVNSADQRRGARADSEKAAHEWTSNRSPLPASALMPTQLNIRSLAFRATVLASATPATY